MKTRYVVLLFLLLAIFIPSAAQTDSLPTLEDLDEGWNILEGNDETTCSQQTDYQFYVRPGAEEARLTIYFQGGGACWNGLLCADNGPFDKTVNDNELEGYDGIFNFENELNPLIDDSIVFIPYCTADVHVGNRSVEYSEAVSIEHQGYTNTAYVLDWVYENFDAPDDILVTGSSAGSYGAIYYAPYLMNHYPDANVVQFGDAGVGITPVGWEPLQTWGMFDNMPEFIEPLDTVDPDTFTINLLYVENAAVYPEHPFAQFTNVTDEVQANFYRFGGGGNNDWTAEMRNKLAQLEVLDNFSYYVAPGTAHTILALPEFYTLESDGVMFIDWFNTLLTGESPANVVCEECTAEVE